MLDIITSFAATCRAADLRVSTSELIDCASHLCLIDPSDEALFKQVLKTNFAKSRREQKKFDQLYDLFFHNLYPETGDIKEAAGLGSDDAKDLAESLLADFQDADQTDRAIADFVAGDPAGYLAVLQALEHQEESPAGALKSNLAQLSSRLGILLKIRRMEQRLAPLLAEQDRQNGSSDKKRLLARIASRLNTAASLLTQDTKPYNDGLVRVKDETGQEGLAGRPFASLSPAEIEEMRDTVAQLVRKLKDKVSRRYTVKNQGILDVKQTLRSSGRYLGVPVEIRYKARPKRKGKIVALCDVSGSVWSAARFMLHMIYAMQDCFTSVCSFAFVSGPTDITDVFERNDPNQAIEKVLSDAKIDFDARTDYGEVFYRFCHDHIHLLNKRTTVIIVGDARSNYHNPREESIAMIREKCRRIIWLNPEPEEFWNTGDSEMMTYMAYCHEVRPCRNLSQLADFIEDLVL